MATVVGTVQTAISTESNSLSNNTGVLGAEQDNTSNNWQAAHFEVYFTTASNATAGNLMKLYIASALDGTNYDDLSTPANINAAQFIGAVVCRATTTHRLKLFDVPLPVGQKWKLVFRNESGVALGATGNFVKYLPYKVQ